MIFTKIKAEYRSIQLFVMPTVMINGYESMIYLTADATAASTVEAASATVAEVSLATSTTAEATASVVETTTLAASEAIDVPSATTADATDALSAATADAADAVSAATADAADATAAVVSAGLVSPPQAATNKDNTAATANDFFIFDTYKNVKFKIRNDVIVLNYM
ncbi:hypothetical protein MIS45_00080 [Wielerella bovis]|uniref:hypothetical protein n=1 Tax=Wielerella bovis TaxID=2917790 RepID=UPI00201A1EDC|nr:hypothetical protein [Wielerella bovis]ULJ69319.1 hypothetical protein MIS45_00080 [Wielerella bovis]